MWWNGRILAYSIYLVLYYYNDLFCTVFPISVLSLLGYSRPVESNSSSFLGHNLVFVIVWRVRARSENWQWYSDLKMVKYFCKNQNCREYLRQYGAPSSTHYDSCFNVKIFEVSYIEMLFVLFLSFFSEKKY